MRSILIVLHTLASHSDCAQRVMLLCKDSLTPSPLEGNYLDGAWYFVLNVATDKPFVQLSFCKQQTNPVPGELFDIDASKDCYHFYEGPETFIPTNPGGAWCHDGQTANRSIFVVFHTARWAPNHLVTLTCLRVQDSLTGSPIFGEYRDGAWYFTLKVRPDAPDVEVAFNILHWPRPRPWIEHLFTSNPDRHRYLTNGERRFAPG